MSIHEEFLQILRILAETPEPAVRKPPSSEIDQNSEAASDASGTGRGHDKCQGAGS